MRIAAALFAGALIGLAGSACMSAPVETEVQADGPTGVLKGTMLEPADATGAPVVLIIPGSGPVDRNGDTALGVKAATYRLLAEALADRGVSSVRIDKRGMYGSAAAGDPDKATIAGYADDVHAWSAAVRRQTTAPCVWLLGHSEGGLVALAAAQRPKDICGLVLAEAAGRPLGDIIVEQLNANPANAPILAEALADVAKLEAGQHIPAEGMSPPLAPLFRPAVQDFLIEEMSYDPAKLLAAYPGSVLVLHGTTDLQVSAYDAHRLAAARPGVRLVEVTGMNHVLKAAPADRAANIAAYADPDLPLAPGVADAIGDFVKSGGKAD